jgi:hypothetical protein
MADEKKTETKKKTKIVIFGGKEYKIGADKVEKFLKVPGYELKK